MSVYLYLSHGTIEFTNEICHTNELMRKDHNIMLNYEQK
jgi:hypothetical protein